MAKFAFRLERVLQYRELEEGWAKDTYLAKHMERVQEEENLASLLTHREELLKCEPKSVDDRLALERALAKSDDDERAQRTVISVLSDEELVELGVWTEKRKELKALQKLKEKKFEEWKLETQRDEQGALDEWSVQRRAS